MEKEIKILPKELESQGYLGYHKEGIIFLKKGLKGIERKKTYWHEIGHKIIMKNKILNGKDREIMCKELKQSNKKIYNSYFDDGYRIEKIPEEFLVEIFCRYKIENIESKELIEHLKNKYPLLAKKLKQIILKGGFKWD